MTKTRKRILSLAMAMVMIFTLLPTTAFADESPIEYDDADKAAEETGVTADKTVEANEDGTYTITLSVQGTSETSSETTSLPADIALIIDSSGSMDYKTGATVKCGKTLVKKTGKFGGTYYECEDGHRTNTYGDGTCQQTVQNNRMYYAKEAATSFVTELLKHEGVKIGLADFSGGNKLNDSSYKGGNRQYVALTDNASTLTTAVQNLSEEHGDGTNYAAGLRAAEAILESGEASQQFVIFISDGEPSAYWSQPSVYEDDVNGEDASEDLIDAGAMIITVGVDMDDSDALEAISSKDSSGKAYCYAGAADGLSAILAEITKVIESTINAGENAVMTDVINTESFELVPGQELQTGLTESNGTLTWNIGSIGADEQTVSFTIKLKNSNTASGQVLTNQDVSLTFDSTAQDGAQVKFTADAIGKPTVDLYKVTYTDGVEDEEVFVDQVTCNLTADDDTPEFVGTLVRSGYTFVGWSPDKEDTIGGTTYDIVYTAQWEKDDWNDEDNELTGGDGIPDKYQAVVTYKVEGGTWDGSDTGDKIEVFTLKEKNGTTGEWTDISPVPTLGDTIPDTSAAAPDATHTTPAYWSPTPRDTTEVKAGTTVYTYKFPAKGDPLTFTFDANGGAWTESVSGYTMSGDKTRASKVYYVGEEVAKIGTEPVREGYEFVGWYSKNADGVLSAKWWAFKNSKEYIAEDTTVYAEWEEEEKEPETPVFSAKLIVNCQDENGASLKYEEITLTKAEWSYTPDSSITVGSDEYIYEGITSYSPTKALSGTAKNGGTVMLLLDYTKDNWNDEDNEITGGDDIPDKYQAILKYVADSHSTVSGTTTKVITLQDAAGNYVASKTMTPGTDGVTYKIDSDYKFNGWEPNPNVEQTINGGRTYTFKVTTSYDGKVEDDSYELRYNPNGGTVNPRYESETRPWIKDYDELPVPSRPGYVFTGWYDKSGKLITDDVKVDKTQVIITAGWRASSVPGMLNGDDHFAYIQGYADGTVRPNNYITRAQVATIFFRLLDEDVRDDSLTTYNTFTDVSADYWANTAISTMTKLGVINGYKDGNFRPNAYITRAEFAAICARFDDTVKSGNSSFTDINGHWAKAEIERAATLGWIQGYSDGTFRPNNNITRAQAMTMINRVLCRLPEDEDDLLRGMNTWTDCNPGDWCYLAVQEATNSHDFQHRGVYESWTDLNRDPDWSKYEN